MKTITNIINSNRIYNIEQSITSTSPKKKVAYFDIETTGLSSSYNQIYLIGVAYVNDDGTFTITQWFDDTSKDEMKLLLKFREFLKKYDYLIEFNGNSFDIPFVEARGKKYGITINFNKIIPIDIYRELKNYKTLFKLDNLKQKSIEKFLGIGRDDLYTGGELIDIYKEYVRTGSKNEEFFNLLMLHNFDDMKGLVDICDMMTYVELFKGDFSLESIFLKDENIIAECRIHNPIPIEIFEQYEIKNISIDKSCEISNSSSNTSTKRFITIKACDNVIKILIPTISGTYKYFYENYKDYYYLPQEDTAIHKSVAQFVDKEYREKAKKDTCYTKKASTFLVQFDEIITPAFKENYKDKISYFEINEEFICNVHNNTDKKILLENYLKDLIKNL